MLAAACSHGSAVQVRGCSLGMEKQAYPRESRGGRVGTDGRDVVVGDHIRRLLRIGSIQHTCQTVMHGGGAGISESSRPICSSSASHHGCRTGTAACGGAATCRVRLVAEDDVVLHGRHPRVQPQHHHHLAHGSCHRIREQRNAHDSSGVLATVAGRQCRACLGLAQSLQPWTKASWLCHSCNAPLKPCTPG